MPVSDLEINIKNNILRTLRVLGSVEEQIAYKEAVPYVHVPYELICQWGESFLKEEDWFREMWSENHWIELCHFNKHYEEVCLKIPGTGFIDVPEALKHSLWIQFVSHAEELLIKIDINPKT